MKVLWLSKARITEKAQDLQFFTEPSVGESVSPLSGFFKFYRGICKQKINSYHTNLIILKNLYIISYITYTY